MPQKLSVGFLYNLKRETDAKLKADTIKVISENLQQQVIEAAKQGKAFVQNVINTDFEIHLGHFLDQHLDDVLEALHKDYFEDSIKIIAKPMIRRDRGEGDPWIDLNSLPPIHRLRGGEYNAEYVFTITW